LNKLNSVTNFTLKYKLIRKNNDYNSITMKSNCDELKKMTVQISRLSSIF